MENRAVADNAMLLKEVANLVAEPKVRIGGEMHDKKIPEFVGDTVKQAETRGVAPAVLFGEKLDGIYDLLSLLNPGGIKLKPVEIVGMDVLLGQLEQTRLLDIEQTDKYRKQFGITQQTLQKALKIERSTGFKFVARNLAAKLQS